MEWYRTLSVKQKVNVRECFYLACGITLNQSLKIFSFSECMDLLYSKLKIEGFSLT